MKCRQKRVRDYLVTCENKATHRAFWPGSLPIASCAGCLAKLVDAAETMGFFLHWESLPVAEDEPRESDESGE